MVSTYIARYFREGPIRFYCLAVLFFAAVILITAFVTEQRGRTVFGSNLGADFAQFYIAGSILNQYSAERLYDLVLQHEMYREIFPDEPPDSSLPYFYPPYYALPFSLLARMPYRWAFAIFLVISIGLYLTGLHLLRESLEFIPSDAWLTVALLAVAFMPFVFEAWMGGQMSVVAFLAFAVVFKFERLGRPLAAGLALAVCTYKPTLLILAIPMLVVSRRLSTLLGFCLGGVGLALASCGILGVRTHVDYFNSLLGYGRAVASGTIGLRLWKYIDLNSQAWLIAGNMDIVRLGVRIVLVGAALWFLFSVARRVRRVGDFEWDLLWGVTLIWTLLLNTYVPIYDSILVIPGILLTLNFLGRQGAFVSALTPSFRALLALVHLVPWFTQIAARTVGLQPYSLVLVGLGVKQLGILRSSDEGMNPPVTSANRRGAAI